SVEDGDGETFLPREECRPRRQGKKVSPSPLRLRRSRRSRPSARSRQERARGPARDSIRRRRHDELGAGEARGRKDQKRRRKPRRRKRTDLFPVKPLLPPRALRREQVIVVSQSLAKTSGNAPAKTATRLKRTSRTPTPFSQPEDGDDRRQSPVVEGASGGDGGWGEMRTMLRSCEVRLAVRAKRTKAVKPTITPPTTAERWRQISEE